MMQKYSPELRRPLGGWLSGDSFLRRFVLLLGEMITILWGGQIPAWLALAGKTGLLAASVTCHLLGMWRRRLRGAVRRTRLPEPNRFRADEIDRRRRKFGVP